MYFSKYILSPLKLKFWSGTVLYGYFIWCPGGHKPEDLFCKFTQIMKHIGKNLQLFCYLYKMHTYVTPSVFLEPYKAVSTH